MVVFLLCTPLFNSRLFISLSLLQILYCSLNFCLGSNPLIVFDLLIFPTIISIRSRKWNFRYHSSDQDEKVRELGHLFNSKCYNCFISLNTLRQELSATKGQIIEDRLGIGYFLV